jgi:hypothetical protein
MYIWGIPTYGESRRIYYPAGPYQERPLLHDGFEWCEDEQGGPGPPGAVKAASAFPTVNPTCVVFLHGCAGRLTALSGGFRPGQ